MVQHAFLAMLQAAQSRHWTRFKNTHTHTHTLSGALLDARAMPCRHGESARKKERERETDMSSGGWHGQHLVDPRCLELYPTPIPDGILSSADFATREMKQLAALPALPVVTRTFTSTTQNVALAYSNLLPTYYLWL